ncbi:RagB/SusD family nutrient uptake outer membrane protein [Prolixibacter bellariivorans]|uniref:RagB/SusD family nutrient uptake outer membrane protein n=1 Tax=Prolixibacter bellariivorans TaxID=314319 RepID=UPI0009DF1DA6|nr:RagB/SusD family nutrient uptake outer membrane protein [Prolixibacter bellariivorans]
MGSGSSDDFQKAKDYADAVISSKGDISIPYNKLWDEAGENNKDFIFTVQYSLNSIADVQKDGNTQSSLFASYGGSAGLGMKRSTETLIPAYQIHHSFQQNDERYAYDFMWYTYKPYFNYYNPDGTEQVMYYNPVIWDPNKTELTAADSAQYIQEVKTMTGRDLASGFLLFPIWKNDRQKYAEQAWGGTSGRVPGFKKFDCPENALNSTLEYSASVRDIVLARLAGTYFLKAEACIALNQIPEARDLVQKVIDRPGNKIDPNGTDLTNALDNATDQQSALEALFLEKGKEMLGEYDGRWPMLRRTKMLKYMLEKYNVDFEKNGITFQDKWYLRPIPENAITLNEGLTNDDQNPGY